MMELTAITKLRHAALWELSKRLGSHQAVCDQLHTSLSTYCGWCSLKKAFPERPGCNWSTERWNFAKDTLESLTGQTIEQLWPEALRKAIALRTFVEQLEQVIEVPEDVLLEYSRQSAERMALPSPEDVASRHEMREKLLKALKTLTHREREIVKLRYGLGDGYSHTLEEVAHVFKVTKNRIGQIEATALRKLQNSARAKSIIGLVD